MSLDGLVAALWGDAPPNTALESLRTHIYRLRRTLGTDGIVLTRPPGYLLAVDADALDAARFERQLAAARAQMVEHPAAAATQLSRALELWRGPAFAEFADEDFARPEARRLEELRLAATEDLFVCKLQVGRHAEVAAEAEAHLDEHPLREAACEHLMLALYRCGQQSRALATYRRVHEHLDTELGLQPSARLQRLEAAVLRQSPELDWSPPQSPSPAAITSTAASDTGHPTAVRTGGSLPPEPTDPVGRRADIGELLAALDRQRLVCLVGTGGVGKSRLALHAAHQATSHHPDGAWWCDLATATTSDAVLDVLAASVGVHQQQHDTEAAVLEALAATRALLVVDNCEHVVGEAGRIIEVLLRGCPRLTILATSRVALDLGMGETRPVRPLALPPEGTADGSSPAERLFLERAFAVRPDLILGPEDRTSLAAVCRRLDGLPLAIELAAARTRSLNVADIAERLDDRFGLLADRRTPARHRTLQAVVDWSFELLSHTEQRLFERLSVFAGAFTPSAAERVCAGYPVESDEVVDLLTRLVDASMVIIGPSQGETTYRLLETMRSYAHSRLAAGGELTTFQQAHSHHYVEAAERAEHGVKGPDEARWVAHIERDMADLRSAHRWAVDNGEVDLALRLSAALFRDALFRLRDEVLRWAVTSAQLPGARTHPRWVTVCAAAGWGHGLRGQREQARRLVSPPLAERAPDDPACLHLLEVQAHVQLWEGQLDACLATMDRAAQLVTDSYELFPWTVRSLALTYGGRVDDAIAMADRARSVADGLGNPTMMALARYSLGEALLGHDPDRAAGVFEHAIDLAQAVDNRMVLGVAGVSATSLRARHGEPVTALRSSAAVLDLWAQTSDWTHFGVGLRSIVELFVRVGDLDTAAVLLGAVADGDVGPPAFGEDAERLASLAEQLEERLGTPGLAVARDRGRTMTALEALDVARIAIDRALHRLDSHP